MVAVFDVLLGVVPCAAARGHRDGHEQAGHDHAEKHGANRGKRRARTGDQVDRDEEHDGREHRKERRNDHFLDRRLGQHVHGAAVVRLLRAQHDARLFAELAADFLHHRLGCAAHGHHRHAAEHEGQKPAEQQADHDVRVGNREIDRDVVEERTFDGARREVFQVFRIRRKQHECAETGRADRVAFRDGLGRVADSVQRIGRLADFRRQFGHFSNAAGIVRHRTEGVERHDHAGNAEHGGGGDGDAIEAGEVVGQQDAADDDQRRKRGGFKRDGQALDDVRAVARLGGFRDRADGTVLGFRVVGRDHDDQHRDEETCHAASKELPAGDVGCFAGDRIDEAQQGAGTVKRTCETAGKDGFKRKRQTADGENAGDDERLVERAHDIG